MLAPAARLRKRDAAGLRQVGELVELVGEGAEDGPELGVGNPGVGADVLELLGLEQPGRCRHGRGRGGGRRSVRPRAASVSDSASAAGAAPAVGAGRLVGALEDVAVLLARGLLEVPGVRLRLRDGLVGGALRTREELDGSQADLLVRELPGLSRALVVVVLV